MLASTSTQNISLGDNYTMDKTEKASISMEIAGNNSGILGEISAGRDITLNLPRLKLKS